jgi:hypothetical protein
MALKMKLPAVTLTGKFFSLLCLQNIMLHFFSKYWGTLLVAQLVEALRYKPEVRGFDSR